MLALALLVVCVAAPAAGEFFEGRVVKVVDGDTIDVLVGRELVREGNAWVYRQYTDDPVLYELEAQARAARRGLWSLPEAQPVPPWQWRHGSSAQ